MTDKSASVVNTSKIWEHPGRCVFKDGKKRWIISALWELAKDLPVQEMPMSALNTSNLCPKINVMASFVGHIKNVLDADMSFPIILDDEGWVMDGRHRVAKALLEGRETIKFVRFEVTPYPDFEVDND